MILKSSKVFLLGIIILFGSCTVQYSFTGINTDAETITINSFFNDADSGPPDLAQVFTDMMRDYFQQNTSLKFADNDGDLQFEGAVTGYRLTPVSPTAAANRDEISTASQTRLTITVSVNFTDIENPENDFTKNFSFYSDFDADQQVTDIEEELIKEIYEQILLNIFNESVANW